MRSALSGSVVLVVVLLVVAAARAQDGGVRDDQPYPLSVKVGALVEICDTGTIVCPAGAGICDDPSVARPELLAANINRIGFRGVGPGTTLCSAASGGQAPRRLYRVKVTP